MPAFVRRTLTIGPGAAQPVADVEWADALVLVARGTVELECAGGSRQRFGGGSLVWLHGLSVRALRNPGPEEAVLTAVSPARPSNAPIT